MDKDIIQGNEFFVGRGEDDPARVLKFWRGDDVGAVEKCARWDNLECGLFDNFFFKRNFFMRSNLDGLMTSRDLQAVFVTGGEYPNTARAYLSNGVDIHAGTTIKKRGSPAVLLVGGMEMEEAAKSGLVVKNYTELGYADILKRAAGDGAKACVNCTGRFWRHLKFRTERLGSMASATSTSGWNARRC